MILLIIIIIIIIIIYKSYETKLFNYYKIISYKLIKNNRIKPIKNNTIILNKPFNEFYINTSHNTYISQFQNFSIIDGNIIKHILNIGIRAIELDIHSYNNIPIVAHGTDNFITTSFITFESCMNIIKDYGFLISDPLILFLEIKKNKPDIMLQIKNIILNTVGNKLLDKTFKISQNESKLFINEPIINLLNKIIIINTTSNNINLEDILDYPYQVKNIDEYSIIPNDNKYMKRIYPAGNISRHLSSNVNPKVFWEKKVNFVAINCQTIDNNFIKNYNFFREYSFIHFSEFNKKN